MGEGEGKGKGEGEGETEEGPLLGNMVMFAPIAPIASSSGAENVPRGHMPR